MTRPTFYTWLITQRFRDDDIGRLACEAAHDPGWPRHARAYSTLKRYIRSNGTTLLDGRSVALYDAWIEFLLVDLQVDTLELHAAQRGAK